MEYPQTLDASLLLRHVRHWMTWAETQRNVSIKSFLRVDTQTGCVASRNYRKAKNENVSRGKKTMLANPLDIPQVGEVIQFSSKLLQSFHELLYGEQIGGLSKIDPAIEHTVPDW